MTALRHRHWRWCTWRGGTVFIAMLGIHLQSFANIWYCLKEGIRDLGEAVSITKTDGPTCIQTCEHSDHPGHVSHKYCYIQDVCGLSHVSEMLLHLHMYSYLNTQCHCFSLTAEGLFLDVIWQETSRFLLHAILSRSSGAFIPPLSFSYSRVFYNIGGFLCWNDNILIPLYFLNC